MPSPAPTSSRRVAPSALAPKDGCPPDPGAVVARVGAWYSVNARDLPWRRPGVGPWAVLVSEFMLQQTPVERVRGPWQAWLDRWPSPVALADSPAADALRAWGRLGYPRRALRLHQAATIITDRHDGEVPTDIDTLLELPGVGTYTAAAVASFAFGQRHVVLDTNVRRVLARIWSAVAYPGTALTRDETTLATQVLPGEPAAAADWARASMELGALVCVARQPRCGHCPVADLCGWRAAGFPRWEGPPRRGQSYHGTDRHCRGALLAVLRSSDEPVTAEQVAAAWQDRAQRERALASLIADGLVIAAGGTWALPT